MGIEWIIGGTRRGEAARAVRYIFMSMTQQGSQRIVVDRLPSESIGAGRTFSPV